MTYFSYHYNRSKNKSSGGFFVEAGAYDGELFSNSLLFETQLGWSGLLIEPNPIAFNLLLNKQRKVWSINACLSKIPYPQVIHFDASGIVGGVIQNGINPHEVYPKVT